MFFTASFIVGLLVLPVLQKGQYRGPEFETLTVSGQVSTAGGDDDQPAAGILDAAAQEGFDRWEFWFEINKDVLIRSRRPNRIEMIHPMRAPLFGAGRVDGDTVAKELFPALKDALQSNDERVIRAGLMGLGKIGLKEAVPVLDPYVSSADDENRHLALLSLGLIEDRKALVHLINLMENGKAHPEQRAYAALAIGLRGSPETVSILISFLKRNLGPVSVGGTTRDLMVAAVSALGMSRDAEAVPFLIEEYQKLKKNAPSPSRVVRAMILTSLGRIGDGSAMEMMVGALQSEGDIEIRRAAALGLGDLGEKGAVPHLIRALTEDSDVQTRGFAAVSLGKIGGPEAREALRKGLADKKSRTVKSFCALALGFAGDESAGEELRKIISRKDEDSLRGAACLGLGFLRDQNSVPALLELVEKRATSEELRGYAAIAIGLIRPDDTLPKLLQILRSGKDRREDFYRGLLLGIGLFRDPTATSDLFKTMMEDGRGQIKGYAALAIGMTRDKAIIEPLHKVVTGKTKVPDKKSAVFAAVALGALGERHNYPLLSEFFYNSNYRIRAGILDEVKEYF